MMSAFSLSLVNRWWWWWYPERIPTERIPIGIRSVGILGVCRDSDDDGDGDSDDDGDVDDTSIDNVANNCDPCGDDDDIDADGNDDVANKNDADKGKSNNE